MTVNLERYGGKEVASFVISSRCYYKRVVNDVIVHYCQYFYLGLCFDVQIVKTALHSVNWKIKSVGWQRCKQSLLIRDAGWPPN